MTPEIDRHPAILPRPAKRLESPHRLDRRLEDEHSALRQGARVRRFAEQRIYLLQYAGKHFAEFIVAVCMKDGACAKIVCKTSRCILQMPLAGQRVSRVPTNSPLRVSVTPDWGVAYVRC
jgi:hypothetical protein